MATFAQIKDVRLRVNDPPGFNDFLEVATGSALPATPAAYTAYKITDTGKYVSTELESGATESDYKLLTLRVPDSKIESWIDSYCVDIAECKALKFITVRLGQELTTKRLQGGAESIEWTSLKDMYDYYKALSNDCSEDYKESQGTNTGRYGLTEQPEIAGGEI